MAFPFIKSPADQFDPSGSEPPVDCFSFSSLSIRHEIRQQFLNAVDAELRAVVESHLNRPPHETGSGLRAWLSSIASGSSVLPRKIPTEVVQIYLSHSEATPLHVCQDCGLAVPVIPSRICGFEEEPDQIFFSLCPLCGGRTGFYLYRSTRWMSRQL